MEFLYHPTLLVQPMEGVQRPGDDEKQLLSRVDQAQIQVIYPDSFRNAIKFIKIIYTKPFPLVGSVLVSINLQFQRIDNNYLHMHRCYLAHWANYFELLQVREHLEDNFDTAGAVTELLSLVRDVHSYIDKCKSVSQ